MPRANTTDPDVRVMHNHKGYAAGYNGQIAVTADQVIIGARLSQHPDDRTQLNPLLDTCRQQLTEAGIRPKPRTVLAGSGYISEENFARNNVEGCGSSRRWPRTPAAIAPAPPEALSLWLVSGAPPAEIAARAGHSVRILLTIYAHCIPGCDQIASQHIEQAVRHASVHSWTQRDTAGPGAPPRSG